MSNPVKSGDHPDTIRAIHTSGDFAHFGCRGRVLKRSLLWGSLGRLWRGFGEARSPKMEPIEAKMGHDGAKVTQDDAKMAKDGAKDGAGTGARLALTCAFSRERHAKGSRLVR